jgi:hypothetical protein
MVLSFQNSSRRFDDARKAVGFMGQDGMFEVRFFVEARALAKPGASEAECLIAFDASRAEIYDAARLMHSRGGGRSGYILTAAKLKPTASQC